MNEAAEITEHINGLKQEFEAEKPKSARDILDSLLDKMPKIDFVDEAETVEKLAKKHFVVIVVDKVLEMAKNFDWGLCKRYDFVYLYNGKFWIQIDENDLKNFLGKAAYRMGVDRFDADYHRFRDELLKQFMAVAHLPEPEAEADTVLINFDNGTLEINPKAEIKVNLREHSRDDFLTYVLPFEYDPEAEAPKFQKYLDDVLHERLQKIVSEFIGYVFVGNSTLKLEKALILYGTGANGKSVLYEIVNALLGPDNVSSYTLQSLTDKNGYYRAKIADKLVNYASEINGNLEASLFKQLVSVEPVEARLPYGNPFTITDYAKLIFNCNELPHDVEHTDAFFRRFMIVPFEITIPEELQDKELASKIINNELSGVFNWVLNGLKRLLNQKRFTESDAIKKAVDLYRKEANSVAMFFHENEYQKSVDDYKKLTPLYREYKEFCTMDGYHPVSKRKFSKRAEAAGYETGRKSSGKVVYVESEIQF